MKLAIVHTSSWLPHAVGIKLVTGGKFNHSLIRFEYTCGRREYFESYWRKDHETGKTGVRGPVAWEKLVQWKSESKRRRFIVQEMPYTPEQCEKAREFLIDAKWTIRYPLFQLWQNFKSNILGFGHPRWARSKDKWTCSECVARVWRELDPDAVLRHLRIGEITFDQVGPSGKEYGLKEAVDRFLLVRHCT